MSETFPIPEGTYLSDAQPIICRACGERWTPQHICGGRVLAALNEIAQRLSEIEAKIDIIGLKEQKQKP